MKQISSIENSKFKADILKWESENGITSNSLTFKERTKRVLTHKLSEEEKELSDNYSDLISKNKTSFYPTEL
jgi:hypothetical protein